MTKVLPSELKLRTNRDEREELLTLLFAVLFSFALIVFAFASMLSHVPTRQYTEQSFEMEVNDKMLGDKFVFDGVTYIITDGERRL